MLQTFPNLNKRYKHIIYITKHKVKLRLTLTSLVYQLVKGALCSFWEEIFIRREGDSKTGKQRMFTLFADVVFLIAVLNNLLIFETH